MRHPVALRLLGLIALALCAPAAHAAERILDYHADIALAADGGMQVTETIRVQAEGAQIRHGIYRDFPTDYRDLRHQRYRVGFEVLGATRDDAPEPWRSEPLPNGVRVYLGDPAAAVPTGEHAYAIRYRTTRQIGFFPDHDELFWNVNGTGWIFPIDRVSASVHLPRAVPASQLKAYGYTGVQGSREQALAAAVRDGGADYVSTRPLRANENMSIVLEFPKWIIATPSRAQRWRWWLSDNRNVLVATLGLAILWAYYVLAWRRHGRDPKRGPLVAEYEPPDGESAAALRYVQRMGYDDTCFAAGILGIAAKGGLTVAQADDDKWAVRRCGDKGTLTLTPPETSLRDALFAWGPELVFEQKHHERVQAAGAALETALQQQFAQKYFNTNGRYVLPGIAITMLAAWLATHGEGLDAMGLLVWLAVCSSALAYFVGLAIDSGGGKGSVPFWTLAGFFALADALVLGSLGAALAPVFVALIGTNFAFWRWLRAPTPIGAHLLDRIRGFRWYLGVAEKQELDSRYRPDARPDLFAAYLPYALALGVGNAWAERFSSALTPAQLEQARPAWYSGTDAGTFNGASLAGFAHSMSSGFSSAIASAAVAPGSGSGSHGGSGGGGGGGGGGGW